MGSFKKVDQRVEFSLNLFQEGGGNDKGLLVCYSGMASVMLFANYHFVTHLTELTKFSNESSKKTLMLAHEIIIF